MKIDPRILQEIRDRITLSDIVGQRVKLKKAGREWRGISPFNSEKSPSFYVNDQKQFFHCFSSGMHGDIFGWYMKTQGMSFPEAIEHAGGVAGVSVPKAGPARAKSASEIEAERRRSQEFDRRQASKKREQEIDERRRLDAASEIWKASRPLRGSPGERYFEARGIDPGRVDSDVIRFSPGLLHQDVEGRFPAIVCKVVDVEGRGRGVWRIYLNASCDDKAFTKASGIASKLGKGLASGGAVRIGGLAPAIGVAEGVETACAVRELNDWRIPCWSLMSTSGFGSFQPPGLITTIYIFSDSDLWRQRPNGTWAPPPGDRAMNDLVTNLQEKFDIRPMPKPEKGDWLDVLQKLKGGGFK